MKDYSQILSKITTTPWMMHPAALKMMLEIFDAHLSGQITQEEIRVRMQSVQNRQNGNAARSGVVGVLPLHGPIFPRANLMTEMSGATSLEQWTQELRSFVGDDSVSSIVMDVDSPGGSSSMIPEVAEEIRAARDVKPIYAVANTMAASAAYGLASQATKLYATPSALVGSIGTYMVHTDDSLLQEKRGVRDTLIKAGRFKAAEIESLTPESRAYFEELVGDTNDRFLQAISDGRGISVDELRATEGKVFASSRSLDNKLIDGIATFEEVLSDAIGGGSQSTSVAVTRSVSGVPAQKQSYDADKEHSEPGTGLGGEPTPREPPEEGDKAIEGGWRRDPPPPAYEEMEEVVNREWLEARAKALGLTFNSETTDEDLANLVAQKTDEIVVPLASATAEAQKALDFAQDYPEQAARIERLEAKERVDAAKDFAQSYARFDGTNKGYSTLVRGKIEESHAKITTRQFSHEDLKELIDVVSDPASTVQWGEEGSSVVGQESGAAAVTGDFARDRKAFADLVARKMTEDNLSQDAAIKLASEENPELARAYAAGHVGR